MMGISASSWYRKLAVVSAKRIFDELFVDGLEIDRVHCTLSKRHTYALLVSCPDADTIY